MLQLTFNTWAQVSVVQHPALYLHQGAIPPDIVVPFATRRRWQIEWSAYESVGGAIGHTAGMARAPFDQQPRVTPEEAAQLNAELFNRLASQDPVLEQAAVDAINDFTRSRMRDDSFYRRIMPPIPITNDELDRAISTDRPVLVVDADRDPVQPRPIDPEGAGQLVRSDRAVYVPPRPRPGDPDWARRFREAGGDDQHGDSAAAHAQPHPAATDCGISAAWLDRVDFS